MSAEAIVKSFIDRILRLKEEQDALSADIREVYAEAKGNGHDKTAMGEVVSYLRKIEKKGKDAVEERGAMFDLYLSAYENASGTRLATHRHAGEASQSYAEVKGGSVEIKGIKTTISAETNAAVHKINVPPHDPETGEIRDTQEQPETENEIHERPSTNDKAYLEAGPQAEASLAGTGSRMLADREGRSEGEAASADLPTIPHSPAPQAPQALQADNPETESSPVSGAISDDDVPAFLRKQSKPLRPHCLNPDLCAGSGSKHCYSCLKARDDTTVAA